MTRDDMKLECVRRAVDAGLCQICQYRPGCDMRDCLTLSSDEVGEQHYKDRSDQ